MGKLYFLLKIHKRLSDVPVRPVISNCGTLTKKFSEYLDSELKSVMQERWSYIKDSGNFIKKLRNIDHIPQEAMEIADVVGLYLPVSLMMLVWSF